MENDFYVTLSSDACVAYYPSNNAADFTVKLPYTLNLESSGWLCGLCEIEFFPIGKTPKVMYVLSDICQESIVNNQTLPLLRPLNIASHKIVKKPMSFVYARVFYTPLKQQKIDRIRVYIKGSEHEIPSFAEDPLKCTLHFKRAT